MAKEKTVPDIKGSIGRGFLKQYYGGKPFIHCIIELLKNGRDWGATVINIITAEARHALHYIDNGDGMDSKNRDAFVSINTTTAHGERQSGQFCSGTKHMLFSFAESVVVKTAPKDMPDYVIVFSFTASEYEEKLFSGQKIKPEVLKKTLKTWPHKFRFGTEIIYTFAEPNTRSIKRGNNLAKELSKRLPMKFGGIVRVDNALIPGKNIIGNLVQSSISHRQLTTVDLEVYRPSEVGTEDKLWLTAIEIGETPFRNFYAHLPSELQRRIPPVYLHREVCGTICTPFLKKYSVEGRRDINPSVSDDPLVLNLIEVLIKEAPIIERSLKLQISTKKTDNGTESEITGAIDSLNGLYAKDVSPPTSTVCKESVLADDGGSVVLGPHGKPAISIQLNRKEFEVGEEINASVKIRKDLRNRIKPEDVVWNTDRALSELVSQENMGAIKLKAAHVGQARIQADIPGSSWSAIASFDVLDQRIFKMSIPIMTITIGAEVPVITKNHDKVSGNIEWRLETISRGELKPKGKSAEFIATHEGQFFIHATDSNNPKNRAICDITVVGTPKKLLCVRGIWFVIEIFEDVGSQNSRALNIAMGKDLHTLFVNQNAEILKLAQEKGLFKQVFFQLLANEFPLFQKELEEGLILSELTPTEIPQIIEDISRDANNLFLEMLDLM